MNIRQDKLFLDGASTAAESKAALLENESVLTLIVTFTVTDPNTFALKADTPHADIVEAANAGRIVYAFVTEPVDPLFGQLSDEKAGKVLFSAFNGADTIMTIKMESDSNIHGSAEVSLSRSVGGAIFNATNMRISRVGEPTDDFDAATKGYVDNILTAGNSDSVVIKSSTPNSNKKFRITVDDAGAITATEVV